MWWVAALIPGLAFMPLTNLIFASFKDRGWIFSRTIGLFFCAWTLWVLNCAGIMPFRPASARITVIALAAVNYAAYFICGKKKERRGAGKTDAAERGSRSPIVLILFEEAVFFGLLYLSVYIIGFRPDAYGTEKFMDYGFMTALSRSDRMPFTDMWFAGRPVNYYYGGQYATVFLMKLAGVTEGEAYNLMRGLITTCSFMLPFSLVYQLLYDYMSRRPVQIHGHAARFGRSDNIRRRPAAAGTASVGGGINRTSATAETADDGSSRSGGPAVILAGVFGGLLGGAAVAFCGNIHYVLYGLILPAIRRLRGEEYFYWFPDSTRYIGYDPDLPDKTIHEFPAYSSVLGDLHAHYINILFVVTVTAVVYAWAQKHDRDGGGKLPFICPEVLVTGFMTGAFRWTNFWDFPIYYVVCGSVFFFVLLRRYRNRIPQFIAVMAAIAAVMFGTGYLASLPFTVTFDQISTQIGLTYSHTLWYQLLILWGLPAACLVGFIVQLAGERLRSRVKPGGREIPDEQEKPGEQVKPGGREIPDEQEKSGGYGIPGRYEMSVPDLAVLMYGLCAAGLVFLPEVIYVKDIYGADHYRANTMFKLSYQAFILFGICMAYILTRTLIEGIRRLRRGARTSDALSADDLSSGTVSSGTVSSGTAFSGTASSGTAFSGTVSSGTAFSGARSADALSSGPVPSGTLSGAVLSAGSLPAGFCPFEAGAARTGGFEVDDNHGREDKAGRAKAWSCLVPGLIGLALLLMTAGYMGCAVRYWFGDISDPAARIHTDASVFVYRSFYTDFKAIDWMNRNISGVRTILEAPGDSYSDYGRISVATGLPTVIGWNNHEYLWRGGYEEVAARIGDVDRIYTAEDEETARKLLEKYGVEYIYIGALEYARYPELNRTLLEKLGRVAYEDEDSCIIAVDSRNS